MRILIIKDPCGEPYLVRYALGALFGYELKLHIMLRSDNDRELHDHPWGFWSLVLAGGYTEEVPSNQLPVEIRSPLLRDFIKREPWALDYRPPEWRHRVMLRRTAMGQPAPWPVKILQWLERFRRFNSVAQWWQAMEAIENQANRHERTCCTLVLTTKRTRMWGFWRDGKFIPHNKFTSNIEC